MFLPHFLVYDYFLWMDPGIAWLVCSDSCCVPVGYRGIHKLNSSVSVTYLLIVRGLKQ